MGFLDKLFNSAKRKDREPPEEQLKQLHPLEKFVLNFSENNGKLLLARSEEQIRKYLSYILKEENKPRYWTYDKEIRKQFLKDLPVSKELKPEKTSILLAYAHYLIESDGGIMFTAYEIGEFRLIDLPDTFVFLATPEQLIETKEKGMELINRRFHKSLPSPIRTIKNFGKDEDSFSKNVYLILYV